MFLVSTGYAADVWWTYTDTFPPNYHYPIPSRTGLHKLPNVIGTGDQACSVDGVPERLIAMGTESLAAFAKGKSMPQAIDLALGY
jgi:phosphoglycerate dehydrogenase-like enzyme